MAEPSTQRPRPFAAHLARYGVVLLDGALATELERRGASLDDPLWSARVLLKEPERIEAVHYDYFAAGANVATTASYQASEAGLRARGLDAAQVREVFHRSVVLAQAARTRYQAEHPRHDGGLWVAASVGPYGATLHNGAEYTADYGGIDAAGLRDFHAPRLQHLAEAAPDLLACETIPTLEEVQVLAALLHDLRPMPAWVSVSCRDGAHLNDGTPIEAALEAACAAPNLVAFGVNCTPPQFVAPLLARLRDHSPVPLLAYPNSGEHWDTAARCWRPTDAQHDLVSLAPRWKALGARLIGGCCRTTPETIRALAETL